MTRFRAALATAAALAALAGQSEARAQSLDFFVGQLQQFATPWCPDDWARADGSLVAISQNSQLFALIGTRFGGDGVTTFGLPDLRDRAPTGATASHPVGTTFGQPATTLLQANLPAHSHGFYADPTAPVVNSPSNSMMGVFPAGQSIYAGPSATPNAPMRPGVAAPAGGSQPMPTQSPVLATNWCIALNGVFPSRP